MISPLGNVSESHTADSQYRASHPIVPILELQESILTLKRFHSALRDDTGTKDSHDRFLHGNHLGWANNTQIHLKRLFIVSQENPAEFRNFPTHTSEKFVSLRLWVL